MRTGLLWKLFSTFFKIGAFTFGGGYAMIATIREEIVEKNKWLSEDELVEIITIAESTPGPIAINMATFVGYKKKGVLGSALATLGVVLPSLIIIYTISLFLDAFMANKYVAYAFVGIQCAVAFLILRAGIGMWKKMKKTPLSVTLFLVALALLVAYKLVAKTVSSVILIIIGGIIGIVAKALAERRGEK